MIIQKPRKYLLREIIKISQKKIRNTKEFLCFMTQQLSVRRSLGLLIPIGQLEMHKKWEKNS